MHWHYAAEASKVLVLHTLCIPPSQKGKGYGRQLLGFAMQYAEKNGCEVMRLDTWDGNHPAAALYEKMGLRLAGTAPMMLQDIIHEQQVFFENLALLRGALSLLLILAFYLLGLHLTYSVLVLIIHDYR